MIDEVCLLTRLLFGLSRSQAALIDENSALRQHLAFHQRQAKRPKLRPQDRIFWGWLSRLWAGRPKVDLVVRKLIRKMSRENPLRGAPKIQSELALIGHAVAGSTDGNNMAGLKRFSTFAPARRTTCGQPANRFTSIRLCSTQFDSTPAPVDLSFEW